VFGSSNEYDEVRDVVILSDRTEYLPMIEIRIKECQGNTLGICLLVLIYLPVIEIGISCAFLGQAAKVTHPVSVSCY